MESEIYTWCIGWSACPAANGFLTERTACIPGSLFTGVKTAPYVVFLPNPTPQKRNLTKNYNIPPRADAEILFILIH